MRSSACQRTVRMVFFCNSCLVFPSLQYTASYSLALRNGIDAELAFRRPKEATVRGQENTKRQTWRRGQSVLGMMVATPLTTVLFQLFAALKNLSYIRIPQFNFANLFNDYCTVMKSQRQTRLGGGKRVEQASPAVAVREERQATVLMLRWKTSLL